MSRQAVTKHLTLLEEANLVATRRDGREKLHFLNPAPIQEIADRWMGKFDPGRLKALANLKRALEGDPDPLPSGTEPTDNPERLPAAPPGRERRRSAQSQEKDPWPTAPSST